MKGWRSILVTASSMLLPFDICGSGIELTRAHNLLQYEVIWGQSGI